MMRVGMFYPEADPSTPVENRLKQCGNNTGNLVFWYALKRLLQLEKIPYDYEKRGISLDDYDAVITTDLIWIRQGDHFDFVEQIMDQTSKPVIPISIGLQADWYDTEFRISDRTLRLLKRMEERAVLGVRGEFTASVLEKSGIHRWVVIGCPSMYYWNNNRLRIQNNVFYPNNFLSNFKTFYGRLSQKEKHYLAYSASHHAPFMEQTALELKREQANDEVYFQYIEQWLKMKKKLCFSVEEWMRATCLYDFSMGARFHGNVISLWNNVKALFLVTDARTRELTNHFKLPSLEMERFDKEKTLQYYFELADYEPFNQCYGDRFHEFVEFLKENQIRIPQEVPVLEFAPDNGTKLEWAEKRLGRDG